MSWKATAATMINAALRRYDIRVARGDGGSSSRFEPGIGQRGPELGVSLAVTARTQFRLSR